MIHLSNAQKEGGIIGKKIKKNQTHEILSTESDSRKCCFVVELSQLLWLILAI